MHRFLLDSPLPADPPPAGVGSAVEVPDPAVGGILLEGTWSGQGLWVWTSRGGGACEEVGGRLASGADLDGQAHLLAGRVASRLKLRLPAGDREVPAVRLEGQEAVELLERVPPSSGASLLALSKLLRFVGSAVRREQFYPSAHRTLSGGEVEGSWRLLVADERDVERLEAFAASMPGACFAADDVRADRLESVETFLNTSCDAMVRRSLAKDGFFSGVLEKAADPAADVEVRWVSTLVTRDGDRVVRGRAIDVAGLLDKVQTWTARLGEGRGDPWRLRLTLQEPSAGDDESWPVLVELTPPVDAEDQHVPLPAAQVWGQPAGSIGFVGRNAVRLRERLTSELLRAGELCPPVARTAFDASRLHPSVLAFSTAEAFRFIRDWSEVLREGGIEVRLPEWAGTRESRVEVVMDLDPAVDAAGPGFAAEAGGAMPRLGLDALLHFDWRVALGGETITPDEFRALVDAQKPLVRRDGRWVEIDLDAAQAARQLIDERTSGTLTLGEAFRLAFGFGREFGRPSDDPTRAAVAAPAVRMAGSRWVEKLLEQTPDARAAEVPQPEGFTGSLRPYQLRGLQWLAFLDRLGLGGCLADDMGLGKTIQLIALMLHEKERHHAAGLPDPGPTLLFVPTSVLGNWQRELERFGPGLKVLMHHGPLRPRGGAFVALAREADVVVTSYALSHRDAVDLRQVTWGRVALDEAQKIKNPGAASSVAVRSIAAPRRLALTGTPVENHLGELWSIMDLLNPGLLGTQGEFRERFAVPIEKQQDRGRARRLRDMIKPFVLRRLKDDPEVAADLPEKMEMNVFCGLTPEQAALYEKVCGEMLGRIDTASGIRRRGLILSVLTKLKQVCNHPALIVPESPRTLVRSGKAQRLAEMLEELIAEGEKALVFTQYRQMGDMLVEMLEKRLGRKILFLHGGTPQPKRDDMVRTFQAPENGPQEAPIFLLSLRAGGLGLNLTAASHVFHFDRWWNPAVENQATDRAHRIGQTRRVQVHKFVTLGTVEERIDRMLAEKSQLASNIVGTGDEWLTELSTGELREYLSLSRDMFHGVLDADGAADPAGDALDVEIDDE